MNAPFKSTGGRTWGLPTRTSASAAQGQAACRPMARRSLVQVALGLATWLANLSAPAQPPVAPAIRLTIGIAQVALEPTLPANRDKLIGLIRQARQQHCRVVVCRVDCAVPSLNRPQEEGLVIATV